jgi:hypothetical protein
MFLSKNSIIKNQIICIIIFSSSDCRARISQYKFFQIYRNTGVRTRIFHDRGMGVVISFPEIFRNSAMEIILRYLVP